jgi:coenzyme F420-0:L-glutamate ligase/coenzyme F420-1:gamma-L-glutamate ligase
MQPNLRLSIQALEGLPELQPGDDLAFEILASAQRGGHTWTDHTILVIAQKVVSKVEGRIIDLRTIEPSGRARRFGDEHERDPRLIELVLQQSRRIIRMERGVIISETHHGFICANAGIDRSNVPGEHTALLLPEDPDASAALIRKQLIAATGIDCPVIISDSFGRPWRAGQVDVAIGVAGIAPLDDRRGSVDRHGRILNATCIAIADELVAAAGLLMQKDAGRPAVLIEGFTSSGAAGKAFDLLRDPDKDLFC